MTIVAVSEPAAVPEAALERVDDGAERMYICGGLGPVPAAAAIEAVGDRASVAAVMFASSHCRAWPNTADGSKTALSG